MSQLRIVKIPQQSTGHPVAHRYQIQKKQLWWWRRAGEVGFFCLTPGYGLHDTFNSLEEAERNLKWFDKTLCPKEEVVG